jgi:hypothetical protein
MMNERIKELAERAGYKHPDAVGRCEDYAYFDHEKFAELIVRECVAICQDIDGEDSLDGRCARQDCSVEIREHFGVEE